MKGEKSLSQRLVICKVSIGKWAAVKADAASTRKIEKELGLRDSGTFFKALLSEERTRPITKITNAIRAYQYSETIPWLDGGFRVLPAARLVQHRDEINEMIRDLMAAVEANIIAPLEDEKTKAQTRLGQLYREADYPTADIIRGKYRVNVQYMPFPNAYDARSWQVPEDEKAQIAKDAESALMDTLAATQEATIGAVIEKARNFLASTKAYHDGEARRYFETAITNLCDVCELVMAGMNVTNDARLDRMARELRDSLQGLTAEHMRTGEALREQKMAEVTGILDKFAGAF